MWLHLQLKLVFAYVVSRQWLKRQGVAVGIGRGIIGIEGLLNGGGDSANI